MKFLYLLLASLLLAGCLKPKPQPTPKIEVWLGGTGARPRDDDVVLQHGSQVLFVRHAPIELCVYRIEKGVQTLHRTLSLDPQVNPMAAFTIYVQEGEAVFEIISPHEVIEHRANGSTYTWTWNLLEFKRPTPTRIGWGNEMRLSQVGAETMASYAWIAEHPDTLVAALHDRTAEGMIEFSKKTPDVSFVLITARPVTKTVKASALSTAK